MSETAAPPSVNLSRSIVASGGAYRMRTFKDAAARWVVWIGGLGVIGALLLIFVYLLSEVFPLFAPAHFDANPEFVIPGDSGRSLYVTAEEQGEMGMRLSDSGVADFFDLASGKLRDQKHLPIGDAKLALVSEVAADRALHAAQLSTGAVLMLRDSYDVTYPNDKRLITPQLEYPYGETPLPFLSEPGRNLAVREDGDKMLFAATGADGAVHLKSFEKTESLVGDSTLNVASELSFTPAVSADLLLVEPQMKWLYVIERKRGKLAFYQLKGSDAPELIGQYDTGAEIQDAKYLGGGISVVVAQSNGLVSQWFPARNKDGNWYLARVREFAVSSHAAVTAIGPELRRRTFAVGDAQGNVAVYYATSERLIHEEKMLDGPVSLLTFNSRANTLIAVSEQGKLRSYRVSNEHPEVSLHGLWNKVWYESYDAPQWLWQSSSASSDFEPKFSFTPLAFGTLKGAFYAMIFAIPLAVLAAIFTANFMSAELRQVVKPTVEMLAALPTVILGFLAGLWLAPFIEANLPGMFMMLLLLPLSIPIFGYLWLGVSPKLRQRVPPGSEAVLLVPVIAVVVWLCFAAAKPMEALIFGGNMQAWMDSALGIHYDQRNALVVGIAMGIAVVPTIFSIAEDAIFGVPKHLSLGSLALGATPWQTLIGVVLPTASPGIFSAVMIGLGRAIGETMIVLMATGNTPVTDFSLFQGMRTFSANIAVEMPESEVGSTHFRLLFLAGLVLFLFTFFFNTMAEVIRNRLRKKYSSI
jgi:phosphate transport system permease protein